MVPPKCFSGRADNRVGPRSRRCVGLCHRYQRRASRSAHDAVSRGSRLLSDSIVVLNKGRIIANGTAEELKRRVGSGYCTVSPVIGRFSKIFAVVAELEGAEPITRRTPSRCSRRCVATLAECFAGGRLGVELVDIALRKPSLDEAFLHLTRASPRDRLVL